MTILTTVRRRAFLAGATLAATAVLASCGSGGGTEAEAGDGKGEITIWAHQGQDSENAVLQKAVDGFNSSQSDVTAKLVLQPGDTYTTTVQNTAVEDLPDVLEMDGPTVASFVYDQKVTPLGDYVSSETLDNATDSTKGEGTVGDEVYAAAMYDSALGLYGNKKLLDAAGVTYPTSLDEAWSAADFSAALATLAAANTSGKALDIQENNGLAGEWGTYAFAPLVWSAGGNLIEDGKSEGVLDSDASVQALTTFTSWKQYVDDNGDGNAFTSGRTALGWGGHWNYPTYSEALGDDLVALPLPNMGEGPKSGSGSWTWGIGAGTQNGKAAGAFLDYLLDDENVTAMTEANGAPAGTKSVSSTQSLYTDGALALWGEGLEESCGQTPGPDCVATARPITPGYPVITSSFGKALAAVWGGADPKESLTTAAQTIDQAYADNGGYED